MKVFDSSDVSLASIDLVYSRKESNPLLFGNDLVTQVNYAARTKFAPSLDLNYLLVFFDVDASGLQEDENIVAKYRTVYRASFSIEHFADYLVMNEDGSEVATINEDLLDYVYAATVSTVRGSVKALYLDTEFRLFLLPLFPSSEWRNAPELVLSELIPDW